MTCTAPAPSPDICPNLTQMRAAVFALLPRGRAWGTHDGGPWRGSVIYRFFSALAELRRQFNARICDMRRQFWCASTDEMLDVWLAQYGLPDDCDAFPDLCDKVRAIGGQTCDYFRERCARKGWTIECVNAQAACGARFGAARFGYNARAFADEIPRFGRLKFGRRLGCAAVPQHSSTAKFGGASASILQIRVYTGSSPSWVAPPGQAPRFGRMKFGLRLSCVDRSLAPLQCLIERIAPAHADIVYEVI